MYRVDHWTSDGKGFVPDPEFGSLSPGSIRFSGFVLQESVTSSRYEKAKPGTGTLPPLYYGILSLTPTITSTPAIPQ
jgi:hypothetical protein